MATRAQQEVQRIVDAIASAIYEHRLPPGARLTEAKLVEVLKANRNHVRAALQKLSVEYKVVDIFPNRGAFVAQPTVEEAKDVFDARCVLEKGIVALAVGKLTPSNKLRLQQQLEKEAYAIQHGDRRDMVRESGAFHSLLADIAGNQVLTDLLSHLILRSSLIIALYQPTSDVKCSLHEHEALLAAIFSGDKEAASAEMGRHIHGIQEHLPLKVRNNEVDLEKALSV